MATPVTVASSGSGQWHLQKWAQMKLPVAWLPEEGLFLRLPGKT